MWRAAAINALSFPFSILAFIIGWAAGDLRTGILAGAVVFAVFFAASVAALFFIKTFSCLDAVLPLLFSVVWSFILLPFTFGASAFSAPEFIGSAVLLGVCMALVKRDGINKLWLILPSVVFLYEMLPVNIPGPFDDLFAFSGSVANVIALAIKIRLKKGIKGKPA